MTHSQKQHHLRSYFAGLWILILCIAGIFALSAKSAQSPGSITWTGTPHGINLTCTASTSMVTGYKFYRGTITGGPYTLITAAPVSSCAYLDAYTNLSISTTYFYVATAINSSGESAYSNQASVTTPATFPQNPAAPSALSGANQ